MRIAEFIRARLDQEEAVARAAGEDYEYDFPARLDTHRHARDHNPARVLRDIAAKRMLLDEWDQVVIHHYRVFHVDPPTPPWLKAFAAVYSEHPEYRERWPIRVKADEPDDEEKKA